MSLDVRHFENRPTGINALFVPAIKVGQIAFLSGMTGAPAYHDHPHRPEDFENIPDDAEAQAHRAFQQMGQALHAAGADFDSIVQLTRFFVHLEEDQDIVNRVQKEYLGSHLPTSATVGVTKLVVPQIRFEFQAIAVVP